MRNTLPLLTAVLALSACGIDEAEFQPAYNAAYCTHRLACDDEAQLRFDGILSQEDCEAANAEAVLDWGAGCRYRGAQAELCLVEMEALTCPADGGLAQQPVSCEGVYTACSGTTDDTEDTEEPADTDPPEDTDAGDDTAAE